MISKDFKQRLSGVVDQIVNEVINVWEPSYDALTLQSLETKTELAERTTDQTKGQSFQNDQFKFLFTQSHELLYILQKTLKEVDKKAVVTFKHANAVDQEETKKKTQKTPVSPVDKQKPAPKPLTHIDAGFSSEAHYHHFQSFLLSYIKFTIDQLVVLMSVTTVDCNTEELPIY